MTTEPDGTHSLAQRLKQHPWIATLLAVAMLVTTLGSALLAFDDARQRVFAWFSPPGLAAADDHVETLEDESVEIDLLSNDRGIREEAVIRLNVDGSRGRATLGASGFVEYAPPPDFSGDDSFAYEVQVGQEVSRATVRITVASVNDAPSSAPMDAQLAYAESALGVVLDLVGGSSDPEGDQVLLDTFVVADVEDQPTRLVDFAENLSNSTGIPLGAERTTSFSGMVLMPVASWVEEAGLASGSLERTMRYTLRDSNGAVSDFTARISVIVDVIRTIRVDCGLQSGRRPSTMTAELLHEGESIGRWRRIPGDDIEIEFRPLDLPLPMAVGAHPEIRVEWSPSDRRFHYECDVGASLNTGLELPPLGSTFSLRPSVGDTSFSRLLRFFPLAGEGDSILAGVLEYFENPLGGVEN